MVWVVWVWVCCGVCVGVGVVVVGVGVVGVVVCVGVVVVGLGWGGRGCGGGVCVCVCVFCVLCGVVCTGMTFKRSSVCLFAVVFVAFAVFVLTKAVVAATVWDRLLTNPLASAQVAAAARLRGHWVCSR